MKVVLIMKIEYESKHVKEEFFESQMLHLYREKILKNPVFKVPSFYGGIVKDVVIFLCIFIWAFVSFINSREIFCLFCAVFLFLFLIFYLINSKKNLKRSLDNSGKKIILELNEEGFSECSESSKIFKKWDVLDYVIIGDYSIVFVVESMSTIVFYYPIEFEKEIRKALKKYCPKVTIVTKLKEKELS